MKFILAGLILYLSGINYRYLYGQTIPLLHTWSLHLETIN